MKKILVIDDDKDILNIIKVHIEQYGFKVFTVTNGKLALDFIKTNGLPDLIICDILMPVMDGWDFLNNFRKEYVNNNIPIILLSSSKDIDIILKGYDCGILRYLTKPFNLKKLLNYINQLLFNKNYSKIKILEKTKDLIKFQIYNNISSIKIINNLINDFSETNKVFSKINLSKITNIFFNMINICENYDLVKSKIIVTYSENIENKFLNIEIVDNINFYNILKKQVETFNIDKDIVCSKQTIRLNFFN